MTYIRDHLAAFVVLFAVCAALVIVGALNYTYAQLGGQPPVEVKGPSAAGSPGFIQTTDLCPAGWIHSTFSGGSTVEETCSQFAAGSHIVAVMFPHDRIANYGRDTAAGPNADPGATIPCKEIPGWPADRCP